MISAAFPYQKQRRRVFGTEMAYVEVAEGDPIVLLRRRMRFGGAWITDSEHVLLLFEPRRYPVAYFPETDVSQETLERTEHTTRHLDLGFTSWSTVRVGGAACTAGAWHHIDPLTYASELRARKTERKLRWEHFKITTSLLIAA